MIQDLLQDSGERVAVAVHSAIRHHRTATGCRPSVLHICRGDWNALRAHWDAACMFTLEGADLSPRYGGMRVVLEPDGTPIRTE
jgi:hypothetical protein